MRRFPGLKQLFNIGSMIVALREVLGSLYIVATGGVYVLSSPTQTAPQKIGTIAVTSNTCFISDSGTVGNQIIFVSGTQAWIYNTSTFAFSSVSSFHGGLAVDYNDTYFISAKPNSNLFFLSDANDGLTWNPLSVAGKTGTADNLAGVVVNKELLYLIGTKTTEIWQDTGTGVNMPYSRINGYAFQYGCVSAATIRRVTDKVFFLGTDENGQVSIFMIHEYQCQKISPPQTDIWLNQTPSGFSAAYAFAFNYEGHSFYCLTIPGAPTTWCFDITSSTWSEMGEWINGNWAISRVTSCAYWNGMNVAGGSDGILYQWDDTVYQYGNDTQRFLRSWRALPSRQDDPEQRKLISNHNNYARFTNHQLQIYMETGQFSNPSIDPQISLRWSDDGGHQWSNYNTRSLGEQGTATRVLWRRLGISKQLRDRVYEISCTDPVPIYVIDAELKFNKFES